MCDAGTHHDCRDHAHTHAMFQTKPHTIPYPQNQNSGKSTYPSLSLIDTDVQNSYQTS